VIAANNVMNACSWFGHGDHGDPAEFMTRSLPCLAMPMPSPPSDLLNAARDFVMPPFPSSVPG
jgi:hypothetical protein